MCSRAEQGKKEPFSSSSSYSSALQTLVLCLLVLIAAVSARAYPFPQHEDLLGLDKYAAPRSYVPEEKIYAASRSYAPEEVGRVKMQVRGRENKQT